MAPAKADPLWLILVIVVPVIVIRRIAQHTVVGGRTVLGAITAYLQIGVAYAALYQAVGVWSSEPPFGTPQESSAYMYLSMTTMSTLGIGDIAPTTEVSRLLVSSEAVLGQVFLVTIVAIVVSQFAGTRRKWTRHDRLTTAHPSSDLVDRVLAPAHRGRCGPPRPRRGHR